MPTDRRICARQGADRSRPSRAHLRHRAVHEPGNLLETTWHKKESITCKTKDQVKVKWLFTCHLLQTEGLAVRISMIVILFRDWFAKPFSKLINSSQKHFISCYVFGSTSVSQQTKKSKAQYAYKLNQFGSIWIT